jgi:hypothetical protein
LRQLFRTTKTVFGGSQILFLWECRLRTHIVATGAFNGGI